MDSGLLAKLQALQVENQIPATSEERRKKREENAVLLKILQEEFIKSKMLAEKMAENEREIKRLEEKRRQDIKLEKVKRIFQAETLVRELKRAEEEMKLRERIAEARDEIQKQMDKERRDALADEVGLLRNKLYIKQLEQRLCEKEMELKDHVQKDEKLESEIKRLKAEIELDFLTTQKLEYTKAMIAAERMEMDESPEEAQYANTKGWVESSGEQLVYFYDHATGELQVKTNSRVSFKYNPKPFGKGSVRFAHYGLLSPFLTTTTSPSSPSSSTPSSPPLSDDSNYLQVVIKKLLFSRGKDTDFNEVREMVRTQLTGKFFAEQFNKAKPEGVPKMIFCNITILYEVKETSFTLWSVEDVLSGDFWKWNNNGTYVDDSESAPQTLSHFSYVHSARKMLLVDIQGVKREFREGNVFMLTDPALHTENGEGFGDLNCGMNGITKFFIKHKCNDICKQMKLDSVRECDFVEEEEI